MAESKLPEKYNDPERYRVLESGAIYDKQAGHIVDNIGGKYAITAETSQAMHQRRRELGLIAHLRGLAKGAGIELAPDADLEEIVLGASEGIEAIVAHMVKTFKASSNLRGMGEAFGKLAAPMVGSPDNEVVPERPQNARLYLLIAQLRERSEIVEGETREVEPSREIDIVRHYDNK